MKYYALCSAFFGIASIALAQSVATTYVTDVNGNRVPAGSVVSSDGDHTQLSQNLNGRIVPLEKTDEKVLSKDANGSVIERIVHKYDRNGQLTSTQRIVIEERKQPGGFTQQTTTYASDVNGEMHQTEHQTVEAHTQGSTTNTQTVVERPTINGSLQPVEKRSAVIETGKDVSKQDETIYRLSSNGEFYPAVREVKDETKTGDRTVVKSALYEPIGSAQMSLSRQSVSTTTKASDGSETTEVNYYAPSAPGVAQATGAAPQLYEQDVVTRRKGSDGNIVETTSARRSSISDPGRLGSPQKVSETICSGKCEPDKTAAPAPAGSEHK